MLLHAWREIRDTWRRSGKAVSRLDLLREMTAKGKVLREATSMGKKIQKGKHMEGGEVD